MSQSLKKIRQVVGDSRLIVDADELRVYECDGLPQHKSVPAAVVLVRSADEVSRVVTALADAGLPFVARGAGTGLSGGALALNGAHVIALAGLDGMSDVDAINRTIRVETGVLNADVSRKAQPFGLYYSPDPSSQTACTIGGNIAENAGGIHCLLNGVTTDHVAAITVVLSDGGLVELHDSSLRPGYDLAGVFVGSEGTFGIATEATLRLLPIPASVKTILAAFRTIREGSTAVSEIIASGIVPAALEMMDSVAIRAVEAGVYKAGLPLDAGAALIIEVEGIQEGVEAEAAIVEAICLRNRAVSLRAAADAGDRSRIWKARKGAFGAMGRLSPDVMIQDAVVPRSRLPEVLEQMHEISSSFGLTVANVFHAGDGNLHPLIPFDSSDPAAVARVEHAGREMMEACIRVGGAITGEHGIGVDKIGYLGLTYSSEDLTAMASVRAAFDPLGLCNPGKAIPVLRGCGEARAVATKKSTTAEYDKLTTPARPVAAASRPLAPDVPFDPEKAFTLITGILGPGYVSRKENSITADPGSYEEVSECLRLIESNGWTVSPMGYGNWLDAGDTGPPVNIRLSTARLRSVVAHEPTDLVATVQAGMTLREMNATLGTQWLPLDPPAYSRSTVGGVFSAGIGGPLSAAFGRPRSYALGMKVALANGTIIKTGGSVVKNVAGYDLSKLFTGSLGTLGVILEISCRLRAKPEADRTLLVHGSDPAALAEKVLGLRTAGLYPSASAVISSRFTLDQNGASEYTLLLRFMGLEGAVDAQVKKVRHKLPIETEVSSAGQWEHLSSIGDRVTLRVLTPLAELGVTTTALRTHFPLAGIHLDPIQGWIRCFAPAGAVDARALTQIRYMAETAGGSLVIDRSPATLKQSLGAWGDLGSAGMIMKRLKSGLDQAERFSPGRFRLDAHR